MIYKLNHLSRDMDSIRVGRYFNGIANVPLFGRCCQENRLFQMSFLS